MSKKKCLFIAATNTKQTRVSAPAAVDLQKNSLRKYQEFQKC